MIFKQIQDQVIETFNTHRMKDNVIEALMTGRTGERDQILGVIEANLKAPSGSVQHMIVYAPRGFGKSFLIRMVQIEAEKKATEGAPLAFVLLPEEQHNLIRSPSTLLDYVAMKIEDRRTGSDQSWAGAMFQWPDPERIKTDWEKAEKGLDEALDRYLAGREGLAVVVVENFDILMSTAFKSKPEEQILRRWMTRRGSRFMLLATATGSVDLDYDRPLFQAFRSVRLQPWTSDDCIDYFNRRRIFIGGQPLSPAEETKARAVSDFIGGTPRLAQLLAEVLDADAGFEKGEPLAVVFVMNQLADKLADYYRNRMNDLPPLAQGLLDALIRGGEPCSATDLAKRVGADGQNVVARTMNDLQRADMIRGLPAPDGREKLFRVVDRVFVHFYRLRQGHAQTIDSPLATILEFLRAFYTPLEHKHQALRFLDAGRPAEADIFARLGCEGKPAGRGYSAYRKDFLYRLAGYLQIAPGAWHTTAEEIERDLQSPAHVIQQGKKEPLHASPLEMAIRSAIIAQAYTRMDLLDKAVEVLTTTYQETKQNPEATIITANELSLFFSWEKNNNDNAAEWALIAGEQQEQATAPFLRLRAIHFHAWSLGKLNCYEKAVEAAQKAAALAQKTGNKRVQAVAMRNKAFSLGALNRHEEAVEAAQKAAALAQEAGDKGEQAVAMRCKAFSLDALKRYEEAIEAAQKAAALAQEAGDKGEQAVAMRDKAFSLGALKRHEEAVEAAQKAAALAQEAGDKRGQAVAMRYKAFSLGALKRHEEAVEAAQKAAALAQKTGDKRVQAVAMRNKAFSLGALNRHEEAVEAAQKAAALAQEAGDKGEQAVAMRCKAFSLDALKRYEEAIEAAQKAAALAQEAGDKGEQAVAMRDKAFSLGALERHEEAVEAAQKATALAQEAGDKREQAVAMSLKAFSLGALERHEEAIEAAQKAAALAQETGDKRVQAVAMRHKAFSLGALERHEEAIEAAQKAAALAQETGDKRVQAVAMRHKAFSLGALERHEEAIEAAKQAASLAEEAKDWNEMYLAHNLTMFDSLKTTGRLPEAIHLATVLCDKAMAADQQTVVSKTMPNLLKMAIEIPYPEVMALFTRWIEALSSDTTAEHSESISNIPWKPQDLLPRLLAAVTRARAWEKLDTFLAQHGSWFVDFDSFYWNSNTIGEAMARVGKDEGRAAGFDAAQGILSRLAKLMTKSSEESVRTGWLTSIISAFAENCRDAGLLRDVAGLLTEHLSPDGPSQARLLEYLADYEAAGDSRPGVLARMDPDVALWIRRIRGLPDESLILPKIRKRKK